MNADIRKAKIGRRRANRLATASQCNRPHPSPTPITHTQPTHIQLTYTQLTHMIYTLGT